MGAAWTVLNLSVVDTRRNMTSLEKSQHWNTLSTPVNAPQRIVRISALKLLLVFLFHGSMEEPPDLKWCLSWYKLIRAGSVNNNLYIIIHISERCPYDFLEIPLNLCCYLKKPIWIGEFKDSLLDDRHRGMNTNPEAAEVRVGIIICFMVRLHQRGDDLALFLTQAGPPCLLLRFALCLLILSPLN